MRENARNRFFVIGFFLLFLLVGLGIYKDYGLSWDDPISRNNGVVAYEYATGQGSRLLTYVDRDYGTAFELPLVFAEKFLRLESLREIYFMRHLATFLLFFAASVSFFLLARKRFGWLLALAGTAALVLSPRIFADSFYNSKDLGLLSAVTIAVYTMTAFLEKPTRRRAAIHALACAFAVDLRMPGIFVVAMTLGFIILDLLFIFISEKQKATRTLLSTVAVYLVLFGLFTVIIWPYLWVNPAGHFLEAFRNLRQFARWDDTVFYFGSFVKARELPWHYPFVWIIITTPIAYLALFCAGCVVVILRFSKNFIAAYHTHRSDLVFLSWFAAPLAAVVLSRSVLYDGWRQLYFIYPGFVLTVLVGLESVLILASSWEREKSSLFLVAGGALLAVNLMSVVLFMIFYHPYQNLYFNLLAGGMERVKKNFEMDYYGLTFRKGLEYIARTDNDPRITVFFSHGIQNNIDILPDGDRVRFVPQSSPEGAKYILTNYRWHPQEYGEELNRVYAVAVNGAIVMSVYKFY